MDRFQNIRTYKCRQEFWFIRFPVFGSRRVLKHWWYMLIPPLNFIYAFVCFFYFITSPLRWYLYESRMKKIRKHAYDIEDTDSIYRLIRNRRWYWGVCE